MAPVLEQLPSGARVLILRLRSLGDCVLTTPAITLLKSARPDLNLAVVVEPRFRAVFEGNPQIDELLEPAAAPIARFGAELCLNLHGGTRSVALTEISRARWRAGFAHFRHGWAYNIRIPRAQEILGVERKVHTAEHLASAMFYLGVPIGDIPRAALYAQPHFAHRPYAVLHPMASLPSKTWPAERFLEIARHLEAHWALEPVFIAGPGEDVAPFSRHRVVQGAPLAEIKSLLAGATVFLGNDSGPAHMAAAFGIPAAVLFGVSDPVIWAPWKAPAEVFTSQEIGEIQTTAVMEALERLRVKA